MIPLDRIRKRLRAERGFTLIELLVAISLGSIVMVGAINLIDSSVSASNEVVKRMDGLKKGRFALEEISQRLRSQVCPDNVTPAIAEASATSLSFYTEMSAAAANGIPTFAPEGRRISLTSNEIREEVWNTLANPYSATFAGTASTTTVLADAVFQQNNGTVPLFKYFTFVDNPATPTLELVPPLDADQRARIVKVEVAFDSRSSGATQVKDIDTSFSNDVYVRTADPTDPEHSPLCD